MPLHQGSKPFNTPYWHANDISTKSTEHKKITVSVTWFLEAGITSLYQVDKCGFREMVQVLYWCYQLHVPHKDYFSRVATPQLYAEVRTGVKKNLMEDTCSFFSASTADLWSSRTIKPYLSYTVHYIDNEWTFQSHHLQAHFMPESHTCKHICESLLSTLKEWNLNSDKQIAINKDKIKCNVSNIKLACRLLNWRQLGWF